MTKKISMLALYVLLVLQTLGLILSVAAFAGPSELQEKSLRLSSGEDMFYLQAGNPTAKPILFIHGYPASSFLYEDVVREICQQGDGNYFCIAPSLIGFGYSSCPRAGRDISPLYQVSQLELFVKEMGLNDFGMVVHDWGGPIGTLAALRNPEQVSHLIVLNTTLVAPNSRPLSFVVERAYQWNQGEHNYLRKLTPFFVARGMQSLTTNKLTKENLEKYKKPYEDRVLGSCRSRAGLNLFANTFREQSIFLEIKDKARSHWQAKPVHFIWATRDPVFGPYTPWGRSAYRKMQNLFPQAELQKLTKANHFLQEDKAKEIAEITLNFINQT